MRGRKNRRWLAVAAALFLAAGALPAGAAQKVDRPAPSIRRRVLRGPDNDWTRYCASNSMNGVAAGEQLLSTGTVLNLHLLWSRTGSGMRPGRARRRRSRSRRSCRRRGCW